MPYNIVMHRNLDGYPLTYNTADTLSEAEEKKESYEASIDVDAENYVSIEEV